MNPPRTDTASGNLSAWPVTGHTGNLPMLFHGYRKVSIILEAGCSSSLTGGRRLVLPLSGTRKVRSKVTVEP